MKPLDKLTELLCENERVNEDIKELKPWCKVKIIKSEQELMKDWFSEFNYFWKKWDIYIFSRIYEFWDNNNNPYELHYLFHKDNYSKDVVLVYDSFKVIDKPLLERHIRMYCEDKNIDFVIDWDNDILIWIHCIWKYDNTKDLYEQSDSVIERILDFLIESKQWK